MTTAFALALPSPRPGRPDFLRRAAFAGNLLRTDCPFSAQTWPSAVEFRLWLDALPDSARAQLAGRELSLVPLTLSVGATAEAFTVPPAPSPPPTGTDPRPGAADAATPLLDAPGGLAR